MHHRMMGRGSMMKNLGVVAKQAARKMFNENGTKERASSQPLNAMSIDSARYNLNDSNVVVLSDNKEYPDEDH